MKSAIEEWLTHVALYLSAMDLFYQFWYNLTDGKEFKFGEIGNKPKFEWFEG